MIHKVLSLKAEGLSPCYYESDPEEKEVCDEDDDDRNYKHHRREMQSQYMERDPIDLARSANSKSYRPFENVHTYRENNSPSSETWRRQHALTTFARAPTRDSQPFSSELGLGRGSEEALSWWIPNDPWISSVDVSSQMVPPGSIPPNLLAGRVLPSISNPQGASWSAYGLMHGVLNGSQDSLHPVGLQGTLRQSICPPQNLEIMRQRCRDFEQRGFCLRGDTCSMEHGVNRIVVKDIQAADSKREVAFPKVAKRQKVGMVAVAAKGEVVSEQVAKSQKVGTVGDTSKAECPNSSDYGTKMASPQAAVDDQKKSSK